jgi:hypothetical protein
MYSSILKLTWFYIIKSVTNTIFNKIPSVNDFNWIGQKPIKSLWKRMYIVHDLKIKKNSDLIILSYKNLIKFISEKYLEDVFYIENKRLYFKGICKQLVTRNTSTEVSLLKHSMLNTIPHEVMQIKLFSDSGFYMESSITHGEVSKIEKLDMISRKIDKMIFDFKKNGSNLSRVQIDHTHPSLDLALITNEKIKYFFNGLSESDYKFANLIRNHILKPVTIRAISPCGWTYSATI